MPSKKPSKAKLVAIRNQKGEILGYTNIYWSEATQAYTNLAPPAKPGKRKEKPLHGKLRYYSPKQIALMLNVHDQTVYKWLKNGTMRGTKVSLNCWRVASVDFRRYLRTNNINSL